LPSYIPGRTSSIPGVPENHDKIIFNNGVKDFYVKSQMAKGGNGATNWNVPDNYLGRARLLLTQQTTNGRTRIHN
jgi:hypothetical protein